MATRGKLRWRWRAVALAVCAAPLAAQNVMHGDGPGDVVRLFSTDAAILESQEPKKDLPCTVTPVKPVLGFDLKFHAGYEVSLPLKELSGDGNQLTIVFRAAPAGQPEQAVYLSHRFQVPAIEEEARGDAYLQGAFDVGEGKYHVDWLMRDRSEHVCSSYWDVEAVLAARDKLVEPDLAPGAVRAADHEPFRQEPPVERAQSEAPLNVKVLVNFAPQNALAATLQPLDLNALVSILRGIARDPRIGTFSIVAFNMMEQKVLYRQENSPQIDFPGLGAALGKLNLGTVDIKRLSQKRGDTDFLAGLIAREMKSGAGADAVIIAGPKVMVEAAIPPESLKDLGEVGTPLFYMNYNLNPQANPWRDAIGNAVKVLKGAEYTITKPRDLFTAWAEIMGRVVKLKFGRTGSRPATQE
jgi:hypothetical protein